MPRRSVTADDETNEFNRRRFLKATGAMGVLGAAAGCTGGGGGDGDGGTTTHDDSDDHDDGDDQDDGGCDSMTGVNAASVPVGLPIEIAINHVQDSGAWDEYWAENCYEVDLQLTFEDVSLFASGQVDLDTFSYVEAARLGVEQDQQIVAIGDIESVIQGVHVKAGGPYDPDTTGSVQASIDALVEDEATFAVDSWASGSLPYVQIIMDRGYGYTLAENAGDFNGQTTSYGTMPQLLLRDELGAAVFAGTTAGAPQLESGEIKPLFWLAPQLQELGLGIGPLASIITRESYVEEEPQAVLSWLDVWNDGITYIHENVDELAQQSDMQEMLNVENQAQAQWILDLVVKGQNGAGGNPLLAEPPVGLSEDGIEAKRGLIQEMVDLGQIPEAWQDHVTFMTRADIESRL